MTESKTLSLLSELSFELPRSLEFLREEGFLEAIDVQFVGFLMRQGVSDESVLWGAALASQYVRQGHICVDLQQVAGKPLELEGEVYKLDDELLCCPDLKTWRGALFDSPVCGPPGSHRPLILDDEDRLYLFRYWQYEYQLSQRIFGFLESEQSLGFGMETLASRLDGLFPQKDSTKLNWQRVAAITALMHPFCVISGGPGTGKTTTVLSILLLLLEQHDAQRGESDRRLQIALAAPTGKAAARLHESIVKQKKSRLEEASDPVLRARIESIPDDVRTLHRLLGTRANSPYFRHNQDNPLPYDVVIVDEASMVDLPLMTKLINALPPHARFFLLGDKDQLASVEAGAVLGDLCTSGRQVGYSHAFAEAVEKLAPFSEQLPKQPPHERGSRAARLQDHIVQLRHSYRFDSESGIGQLARLVNRGEGDAALQYLRHGSDGSVAWRNLPKAEHYKATLRPTVIAGYQQYLQHLHDPEKAFKTFETFRILCAHRTGPYGVQNTNLLVEQLLREQGLLQDIGQRWYPGRPVMIQRNDYNLKLFNGDIGLLLPDPRRRGALSAFFPTSDGGMRSLLPARLPEHETVFAMTVHKSQGSEFDRVLVVLPEKSSPILTRELVYTGLTRARKQVGLWGVESVFVQSLRRQVERSSGLRDWLWSE